MKLTKKLIKEIESNFKSFIIENDLGIDLMKLEVGEDFVNVEFPREQEDISFNLSLFLIYLKEINSIEFSESRIATNNITQIPVFITHQIDSIFESIKFTVEKENEYSIRLIENPFFIGLANVKFGYYNKYFPPCSTYYGIEVEYKDLSKKLSRSTEEKIIKSFLFEFSHITRVSIEITSLHDVDIDYYSGNEEPEVKTIKMSELKEFNESMDLYLKAINSFDKEMQFLYYYKIIEYFSPIIAQKNAYEVLLRKIDSIKYKSIQNEDLNKIFEISDSYRKSKTDSELCKTVLSNSVDVIDLFFLLSEHTRKNICKNTSIDPKTIKYGMPEDKIDLIFHQLGKIFYSTRNSIVHAKSNYNKDGFECTLDDFDGLNEFLNKATYQIINWHSNLPKHIQNNK